MTWRHKARGYGVITDPDPPKGFRCQTEFDVAECSHCNKVIMIKPGVNVHRCTCCDGLICTECVGKGCDPLEEKLRRWENRASLMKAMSG